MKRSLLFAVVVSVLHAQAGSLSQREINQIETDLNVSLSSNDVVQLSAIVNPTNMPQWRVDAYDRIDTHRKAELGIQVVDMNGDPVEGAQVAVKLRSNDFKFGGVMSVKDMNNDGNILSNNGFSTAEYQNLFLKMFNSVGLDNGFKPKQRAGNEPLLPGFISWAQANDLPVRGHLLIWPGNDSNNHLPDELPDTATSYSVLSKVEAAEADTGNPGLLADLKSEVDYMIGDWASKWNVYEWDVINETLSNYRVQDLLGYEETAEWFKIAENNVVDPDCKLLINEYQIISARSASLDPGHYTDRRDRYYESIDYVIDNGGRLDRIGFQSRVKFEVPNPQTWYDRLDEFATAYGLPMVGTEFEVRDTDPPESTWYPYDYTEQERAEITESLLTAYFSHPLTTGLNAWTYMKNELYSMCYYDGTVKLNGLAWYYLHRIRYNTDVTLASSLEGRTGLRAFKGEYDLTISYKGQDYAATLTHTNDQSIVIALNSSVADDPNTSEVVDAWHYDGLTNGSGLAQGVSTGTVGGVFFNNNALASIQNETVRWQSDGISDSMYQGKDISSYDGASNGVFQLSVDFLDADFTATSALSNGTGRVNFGIRNDPGGSDDDAYFRLTFVSGGGSNAQYRLEVKDALNNNLSVASFPGATLDHLAVRAVYDLDNDTFNVYYRHDGAGEVLAHSGTLVSGFALDQMRAAVQTFNGSANWAAGDRVFTDNLVLRKLGDPPPPPTELVLEQWTYAAVTNGAGLAEGLSVTGSGLAWPDKAPFGVVSNEMQRWEATGAANEGAFANIVSASGAYKDATNGIYQLSFDVVYADFANTDVAGGKAQFGYGIRDDSQSGNDRNGVLLVRYEDSGGENKFHLRLSAGVNVDQDIATGHTISNLHVRAVYDLNNAGNAGSFTAYFSIDGGAEAQAVNQLAAGFTLQFLRMQVQALNGGNLWEPGDVVLIDNIELVELTATGGTPASLYGAWLADYPTIASTNIEDNLLFYAFGANPTNPASTGNWPMFQSLEASGTNYIEYVYAKRNDAEARGLAYVLENTDDLVSGSWTNAGFEFVGEGVLDGEFDTATNRLPATDGAGFIRLNIGYAP